MSRAFATYQSPSNPLERPFLPSKNSKGVNIRFPVIIAHSRQEETNSLKKIPGPDLDCELFLRRTSKRISEESEIDSQSFENEFHRGCWGS